MNTTAITAENPPAALAAADQTTLLSAPAATPTLAIIEFDCDGDGFIARHPQLNVTAKGTTIHDALNVLGKAVESHMREIQTAARAQKERDADLLTIKEASEWATTHTGKTVTTSNVSYLIQYGRVKKIGENGATQISKANRTQTIYFIQQSEK
jgi:hypothetical protein